jgi:hypothetical protein
VGSTLDGYVGAATQVVKAAELVARQTAHSGECQWALTGKRALTGGGALKLLEHAVLLDAARDDDGGVETKPLAREVDLLGRLRTLELGDRKRVTVDTATRGEARCQWALSERRTLGAAAHFSSLSTPLSLMQLAMMMAEATPSLSLERLIFLVPFSSSI